MRVLLVSDFMPPVRGGLELHVARLARNLSESGDTVAVATVTSPPDPIADDVRVHVVRAASSRVLPYERADRPFHPPLPDPLARHLLAAVIDEFRPDVVHAHNWLGVSLPRRRSIPLVFTAHDYAQICPIRTLVRPDDAFCSGPAPRKCASCGEQKYRPIVSKTLAVTNPLGRRLMRPDRVIAVSNAVRSALAPHMTAPIHVVPNFVDEAEIAPDVGGDDPLSDLGVTGPYVLFAGRMERSKGVDDLLTIWRETESLPPLVVATTSPADPSLATENVSFVSLPPDRMAAAWRGATLAVVPSRWPDPCPTVVLEALRAGVPVVGYDVGGVPDMVRDGEDGLLVPVGDVAALRDALLRLLSDDELRRRMSVTASRRAREFVGGVVVPRIRAVYDEALRSVSPAGGAGEAHPVTTSRRR